MNNEELSSYLDKLKWKKVVIQGHSKEYIKLINIEDLYWRSVLLKMFEHRTPLSKYTYEIKSGSRLERTNYKIPRVKTSKPAWEVSKPYEVEVDRSYRIV